MFEQWNAHPHVTQHMESDRNAIAAALAEIRKLLRAYEATRPEGHGGHPRPDRSADIRRVK
jgi:hypothetical protein